jgi:hypothetical protein
MTTQQSKDVYPLVYQINIVDHTEFPDISITNRTLLDTDHSVAVADDYNMYTVMNTVGDADSSGSITKLQRQDFHEHYFVAETIDQSSGSMAYEPYVADSVTYPAKTKIKYVDEYLYVMSLSSTTAKFRMEQFTIVGPPHDLSLNWRVEDLGDQMRYFQPERYDNHDLFGFVAPAGEDRVWAYYYDYSLNGDSDEIDRHIMLHRFDAITGVLDNSLALEGIFIDGSVAVNGVRVDKPDADQTNLAVILNTGTKGIQLGHIDIVDGVTISLGNTQAVSTAVSTMPASYSYYNTSRGTVNTFMTYVETADTDNLISFADSTTTIPPTSTIPEYFTLPYRYSIDKTTRFSESYSAAQVRYNFAVTTNPLNSNILYLGYITSDGQIRVIKIYRFLPTGQTNYEYLLMWATVANGTQSAFSDPDGDFTVPTTTTYQNSLSLTTDKCGELYIFCRTGPDGTGTLRMWKLREYELDFGQNILGATSNTDPTLFPDFLAAVADNYSVMSQESSLYLGHLPSVSDIIIANVQNIDNKFNIIFKYIDYDIFQSLTVLGSGLTVAETFNADLITVLQGIYGTDNGISILNFNSDTELIYDGTRKTMIVIISATNIVKPCLTRGTQVIAHEKSTGQPYMTTIEKLKVGDCVVNQDAKPVKIIHHTRDTVVTDDWTSPYLIPPGYFGVGQPYSTLFISGDHGIRMTKSTGEVFRVYPYTITNDRGRPELKRVKIGTTVEYHHIKLEQEDDFFMANGLLVEGLRNTFKKNEA